MSEDRTLDLLNIMDLAKQWPQLQAVHDLALAELLDLNEEAKATLSKRNEAKAQAQTKIQPKAIPAASVKGTTNE